MKKLVFVLALIAVSAHAQFYTNTYNYNSGFMHYVWQFDFATVDRPREFGVQIKAKF